MNDKYQHVHIYDADNDEIRRIVNCERSTASRPCRYTVVAQFIAKRSGDTEADGEDEFVSYFINDELYMCIIAAPALYIESLIQYPNQDCSP